MTNVRVTLIKPADRRFFQAQWDDPETGLTKTQSTKCTIRREAERFAAKLEAQIAAGESAGDSRISIEAFKKRYLDEVAAFQAEKTKLKSEATFNAIERLFPARDKLAHISKSSFASRFSSRLRSEKVSDSKTIDRKNYTVRGHLSELRKFLRWAKEQELIAKVPTIRFPPKSPGMKGRPITLDESRMMIDHVADEIPQQFVDGWVHYLEGLWPSSLRLEESMILSWDDDTQIMVDLFSERRPMFRIQAMSEKGREFRMLPMAPDFAEWLMETRPENRHGFVFNPLTLPRGKHPADTPLCHRPTHVHVGKIISRIGKAAGVMVTDKKYASAHDFRRAFGFRWCKMVMPAVLQEMMRHASIQTTMEFYVGKLACDAADQAWEAALRFGITSGNSEHPSILIRCPECQKLHNSKYTPLGSNQQPSVP